MIATSIEQSKKLLELGINPETADMCFDKGVHSIKAHLECDPIITYFTKDQYNELVDRYVPAWSLNALIELLPEIKGTPFVMQKFKTENNNYYNLEYEGIIMLPYCKSLVDGCVEMIEKLKKENLI